MSATLLSRIVGMAKSALGGSPVVPTIQQRYEAAYFSPNRSLIFSPAQDSKRDINSWSRLELLRKGRYLYKNSPLIRGLVERLVTYVVGTGLIPVPATSDPDWNERATEVWNNWSANADLQSRNNFRTVQAIVYRSALIDGDIGTLLTYGFNGRPRVQLIEGHLIGGYDRWGDDTTQDGVVMDRFGRPKTYKLRESDDLDKKMRPVDARNFILHYIPERGGQVRGVTALASAINTAQDVDDILALEKAAVKDASSKTDIIKTAGGEITSEGLRKTRFTLSQTDGSTVNRDQYYKDVFGPESKVLQKGDEFTPYESKRPGPAWEGFMDFLAQTICLSLGVPPSILLQLKVGGADTRRDLAAAQRVFEVHQGILSQQFQRVYEYVIEAEINDGALVGAPADWRKTSWQLPKAVTVDYGRESKEDREDVKMALLSLREYYGRYGMDWKKELMQIAEEQAFVQKLAEEHGLKPEDLMLKNPKMLKPDNENVVQD